MSLRSHLAIFAGKSAQWILKTFFKGGSSYPGQLALKIDPNVLDHYSDLYEVVVVTGTNGKTLTTALTVNILQQQFDEVLTNPTGANMVQGIVSTFLSAKPKKNQKNFAVLEIDEASLSKVTEYIKPELFVFTNIFRDQMDRYGEIYTTYRLIVEGAAQSPNAPILCNGDSPIFNSVDTVNPRKYYGFDHLPDKEQMAHYNTDGVLCPQCHHILHYKMITYANLGKYYCPNCGFHRPELDYKLTKMVSMDNTSADFIIDGQEYGIEVGGMYNVYNALAATAVAEYYDVPAEKIKAGLGYDEKVFGRQEIIDIDGKKCTLVLVKNPVGLNQVIDMIGLSPYPFSLVALLNANYADGIDVSWIWDGNHEAFAQMNIPAVIAGGERHKDMALRLKVAGITDDKLTETKDLDEVIEDIKKLPTENVYILATYTAVLQLRKKLAEKGYIKGGMDRG
ncbi:MULTISPECIES: Mur ligase family protein [Enterococcus]|uniref:Lipid II isoglutaminyl synthase (glutamine-hydrolyzing) subunit MurT n=1 Tax=Enterococcus dispar ATCC 51266 TaxID=1139219 RepID=S0K711_9ENTE|nr:Mur ligase family protein [Enterococcus dispar]EOT40789.1 Mur ligase middle protein [Enterococcus dispar ATCC 51266]EOW86838.1 Mur ligase middle protein [Enterococcus dispar ATCC 51266]MCU7357759.1 Mur ligase family protein [Enterococcus dispar]MDT2706234.1 Mur ligase family protein [Enterococcus dispar]OJG39783.1 Mur ligase middle protein [Enterococcus dispar]